MTDTSTTSPDPTPPHTVPDRKGDPVKQWAQLRAAASGGEQRACVAAATRQADTALVALRGRLDDPASPGVPRRDASWHRLALSGYQFLRESNAYGHLARQRPLACAAATPIIEAWLAGPAPSTGSQHTDQADGDAPATMAHRLGLDDVFHTVNADTRIAHMSTLLTAAQDAGVFGVPGHHVELVRATGAFDRDMTVVRLVVDPAHGPAMASEPFDLDALIDADSHGVAASAALLRRVADRVSDLFTDQAKAVWRNPPPMPADDRTVAAARAFPELRLGQHDTRPSSSPASATSEHPTRTGRTR